MTRPYDLVALGDPVLDLIVASDDLPRWDDKHLGRGVRWVSGGCEANAACAAARMGLHAALLGHAGSGPVAALHRQELARHGVSLEHLRCDDGLEGAVAVVYVSSAGERAVTYVAPRPSVHQRASGLAEVAARTRLLYMLPYDAVRLGEAASLAQAHGAMLAVDVERAVLWQPGMHNALSAGPDLLCFNAAGFRSFTGQPDIDEHSLERALAGVRAQALVVTLGRSGAIGLARGGTVCRQPAWPAEVRDTTGAGDAFNGTWLAAWLQGAGMAAALQQAARMAALCIESTGPRSYLGLPDDARPGAGDAGGATP